MNLTAFQKKTERSFKRGEIWACSNIKSQDMGEKANFPGLMSELKGSCWYEPQLKQHQLESSVMKNKYS